MQLDLIVMPGGLLKPSLPHDADITEKWGQGELIRADVKRPRNAKFHRKFMALMQVGFNSWEANETTYKDQPVQKNFERFRKDITILCGYYDLVTNIKGEVKAEAKSIAFGNMDEDTFADLYNKAVDVLLQHVLTNYTREDVDDVVAELMNFARG